MFIKGKNYEISNILKKYILFDDIQDLEAEISNNIKLELDKTYKVKSFKYTNNGKIKKSFLILINQFTTSYQKRKLIIYL